MKISLSEHFFSIQGEGVSAGVPSLFIRFGGCNLLCGGHMGELVKKGKATWWCDTETMWMKSHEVDLEDIWSSLTEQQRLALRFGGAHVVYTGGEPCMPASAHDAKEIQERLHWPWAEVETNGTIDSPLLDWVNQVNCSPKLANSGMPRAQRFNFDVLRRIQNHGFSFFKFVVTKPEDWEEIEADFIKTLSLHHKQIILMPGCDRRSDLAETTRMVWELSTKVCVKMCTRMHILAYDKLTGV